MSTPIILTRKVCTHLFYGAVIFSSLLLTLTPFVSLAQDPTGGPEIKSTELKNPLNVNTIEELIEGILNIVLILAVPVIVFFIIYAGFLYTTARGNAEQVKQATTALTYALIGGVLIIGSVAIAEIVKELVFSFKAGS
ncbi:MAG TPA: pilin [Candidatus Paceibacterota bacterium]|nr:pilin [Candidatus Paceibacterota bacterium]HMO83151.1 pilin [Candidatus Paceibacterota bacterium]